MSRVALIAGTGPRNASAQQAVEALAGASTMGPVVPRHFFWLIDLLSLTTAFFLAYALAPRLKDVLLDGGSLLRSWVGVLSPEPAGDLRPIREVAWVLVVMSAVTLLSVQATGGYRPLSSQSRTRVVLSAVVSPLLGLSAVGLILFTLRSPSWSRLFVYLLTAFTAVELASYRLVLRWYRTKRVASGFYARNLLLIGPTAALEWLADYIDRHTTHAEYQVVGYLSLAADQPRPGAEGSDGRNLDLAHLGQVDQLASLLVHHPIHEVIAVEGSAGGAWLHDVVEACDYFRVTLRIVPEALLLGQLRDLSYIFYADPLRLPQIVLRPRHLDSGALFVKRVIDIVVSATLLVLLSPLLLLIALAIKLTTPKLPVFYPWRVIGYKGRPFTGYKFTTMVADADDRKGDLMHLNEMNGPVFKITHDPRVTPLGRFLRKFSLNELPQLWSVLKGDMSLVGPRPAGPHELARYELWHKRKLCVQPGITCLWQIRGRNKISNFDDWVRMDFEYIDNWSLWLDCRILIRTAWTVVGGTGS